MKMRMRRRMRRSVKGKGGCGGGGGGAGRSVKIMAKAKAAERTMWYPGATPPAYLDGSIPGDFGFDPLRLGETGPLGYYAEAELMNGRWAMAAVLGCVVTEAAGLPVWYEAGAADYSVDLKTLGIVQLAVMGVLEYKRFEGFKKKGTSGFLSMYPFDPLNYSSPEFQKAERMNGRIAMLAFAGFIAQAGVQGKGPVGCLVDHVANPGKSNVYTTGVGPLFLGIIFFLVLWPMIVEVRTNIHTCTHLYRRW